MFSHRRQVSEAEGKELADSLKAAWVETSARHNANVTKVFELMLSQTDPNTQEGAPEPQPSKCVVMQGLHVPKSRRHRFPDPQCLPFPPPLLDCNLSQPQSQSQRLPHH